MARKAVSALKKTPRKRIVRVSRTAEYLANLKYLGEEPVWTGQTLGFVDYTKTMTWYNYMCTKDDARSYLETYFKNTGRNADLKRLKGVPDSRIVDQAAWCARVLSRGAKLDENSMKSMENLIKKTLSFSEEKKPEKKVVETTKPSIQDRVKDKVSDFIGQFEEAIDREGWTLSMYEWLQKHEVSPMLANRVADFFRPIADEAELALTDESIREGYSTLTKRELKQRSDFYSQVVADCERFSSNTKKTRTPRKPKPVSVEKKLKDFKYLKESKEFRVASVPPERVIGANEVWLFNTKYRLITVLRSVDRGGFLVSGSTLKNVDEKTSQSKRLGRGTEKSLETILKGGKRVVAKLMDGLKDTNLQTRVNENVVIMKASKE